MGVFALRKRLIIVFSKKVRRPVPKPQAWVVKQGRREATVPLLGRKSKRTHFFVGAFLQKKRLQSNRFFLGSMLNVGVYLKLEILR